MYAQSRVVKTSLLRIIVFLAGEGRWIRVRGILAVVEVHLAHLVGLSNGSLRQLRARTLLCTGNLCNIPLPHLPLGIRVTRSHVHPRPEIARAPRSRLLDQVQVFHVVPHCRARQLLNVLDRVL